MVVSVIRPVSEKLTGGGGSDYYITWYQWFLLVYSFNTLYCYFLLFGMLR